MVHLCKERYPQDTYNKLKPKKLRHYEILKRINENLYLTDLPKDLVISPIFNAVNLYSYQVGSEADQDDRVIEEWAKHLPRKR